MKKFFLPVYTFLCVLLFGFISYAQNPNLKTLDTYIENAMKDWQMPGFAVAIVKNDSVVFSKAYGVREIEKTEPVDENTLFVIASCSKAFTTTALSILVDEGKINWDDPVTKYLPDFQMYDPWVTKEINIRDLLTHRSGLATFSGDFLWINSTYSRKDIIKRIRYLKPVSSFRTKYGYQNLMYITAAEIIKAVTDTSWGDFIQAHILNKIGMTHTNTRYEQFYKTDDRSRGHYLKNGQIKIYAEIQGDNAQGALGINSCINDMTHWIRLQLNKGKYNGVQVFSTDRSNDMWANQFAFGNSNYGLGWFINYYKGKKILDHGGGMPGYISNVTLVPEEKLGFVIFSNLETGMVSAIKNKILDLFLGGDQKDWNQIYHELWNKRLQRYADEIKRRDKIRNKESKPSLPLKDYTGTYRDKMYGNAEVSIKNDSLYLQFVHTPTFGGVLHHYQYDTFYIDWEDEFLTRGYVKFGLDFSGKVKRMTFEVPNSPDFIFTELLFEKLSPIQEANP